MEPPAPDEPSSTPWSGRPPGQGGEGPPPGQGYGGPPPGQGYGGPPPGPAYGVPPPGPEYATRPPGRLGGRWRRLFAGILDLVIVGIASSPFTYQTAGTAWDVERDVFLQIPVEPTLAGALIGFLYYWLLTAFWHGQTLGKKLTGLRVVDVSGRPVEVGQAAIREVVAWVLYATCCLGWINLAFILFTEKKQAIHDMAAKTLVVDA